MRITDFENKKNDVVNFDEAVKNACGPKTEELSEGVIFLGISPDGTYMYQKELDGIKATITANPEWSKFNQIAYEDALKRSNDPEWEDIRKKLYKEKIESLIRKKVEKENVSSVDEAIGDLK